MTSEISNVAPTEVGQSFPKVSLTTLSIEAKIQDAPSILDQTEALREEARNDWERYYKAGRNATKQRMQKLYALYYATLHSDQRDYLVGKLKKYVPAKKIRKSTKEAAIFVRYVFEDLDDKQVHVYSTSLEVAYEKLIEPTGFISWVEGHKGEFDGIRAIAAQTDASSSKTESWKMGMDWANGAQELSTIAADDWDEDEPCRILIAVPKDDGSASVKDTELTLDQVKEVLAIYSKAVAERNKPKGKKRRSLTDDEKKAKFQLKADLSYQKQLLDEYRFDLSDATKRDHLIDKEMAEYNICLVQAKIVGIKASINALGGKDGADD